MNPIGSTSTEVTPESARPSITSSTEGPSHGSLGSRAHALVRHMPFVEADLQRHRFRCLSQLIGVRVTLFDHPLGEAVCRKDHLRAPGGTGQGIAEHGGKGSDIPGVSIPVGAKEQAAGAPIEGALTAAS